MYPRRSGRGGGGENIITKEQLIQLAQIKGMSMEEADADVRQYEQEGRLEPIGKQVLLPQLSVY
jgi:hypothetical protein